MMGAQKWTKTQGEKSGGGEKRRTLTCRCWTSFGEIQNYHGKKRKERKRQEERGGGDLGGRKLTGKRGSVARKGGGEHW